jgi:hypothetical protein
MASIAPSRKGSASHSPSDAEPALAAFCSTKVLISWDRSASVRLVAS